MSSPGYNSDLAGFCENCKVPAKRLIDERSAESKTMNESIKISIAELVSLKTALEKANRKAAINDELCDKLKDEIEILQELLARSESSLEGAVQSSKEVLELAKMRILELEEENKGLKKYDRRAKRMAIVTGVLATVVGSGVCFAGSELYRNIGTGIAAFGAGTITLGAILHVGRGRLGTN